MDELEQDQDTGIWRPKRRTFIIMLGTAMAGTILITPAEAATQIGIDWASGPDYLALASGNVGLGTFTLGKQPARDILAQKEYLVVDGHVRRARVK